MDMLNALVKACRPFLPKSAEVGLRQMDGYSGYPSEFDQPAAQTPPAADVTAAIGTDERRMHVRAYNYWVSLLEGRDYPSIEDLEPADVNDFAANSVLLDFTCGRDNPATPYIGAAIREECGLGDDIKSIDDVPSRSLLSRLTDHYMQIIANRAPVGFVAEFVNQRGASICYRGILMPFSSDGDTIDFIYGVINWKQGEAVPTAPLVPMLEPIEQAPEEEEPLELEPALYAPEEAPIAPAIEGIFEPEADEPEELVEIAVDEDAGLADRLWAARETAEAVKSADGRSRAALYRALALAYDFAIAAHSDPQEYAELLEESGMKAQARAPMTPIVKLVFGIDYDKTRLTEFASALSYAQRRETPAGGFQALIEEQPGGLKALVAAERQARRPERSEDDGAEKARASLRQAPPLSLDTLSDEEFCLVVTRRGADGSHEAVALVNDPALLDRALRRAV